MNRSDIYIVLSINYKYKKNYEDLSKLVFFYDM